MYDVFFSYPHKDSEKVMLILEALQTRGLKVWIDRNEIQDFAGINRWNNSSYQRYYQN